MTKARPRNPFRPTFGASPPSLVGRDDELAAIADALDASPGHPFRATLVTGLRGSGKTVFLNAVEDLAEASDWVVISETARTGLVDEMVKTRLPQLLTTHDRKATASKLTGANASAAGFGLGATREVSDRYPVTPSLRSMLERLTEVVYADTGGGVLITLDEVHRAAAEDLQEVAQTIQHLFRQEREVMLVAAGLPSAISDLLRDKVVTFLRRAERITMGAVDRSEVRRALREPIENAGRSIGDDALEVAADGTKGYPFMVQLVGYQCWNENRAEREIHLEDAHAGVAAATRRIGRLVHEPALQDLSAVDRSFLAAMAQDDGPSRTSDIADRLGVSVVYASQYRLRLKASGLIEPVRHGYIDFTVPYLRTYLREHATSEAF